MKLAMTMCLLVAVLGVVGCGKKNTVDTSRVEKSFQSADPGARSGVDQAVASVKAGNYSEALGELQQVAAKAKLTSEQQQAIQDLVDQVQKAMAAAVNQGTKDAQKTADDMKKSLPMK